MSDVNNKSEEDARLDVDDQADEGEVCDAARNRHATFRNRTLIAIRTLRR